MHVAEKLCDRIAVIMDGEIKMIGTLKEIYEATGESSLDDAFFRLYDGAGGRADV